MKKLLLFTAFAVFALTSVNAQKFGVKGGVNFASLGGDVEDVDGKTGFHIGGVVDIELSELLSFQPELLVSTQGAKSEETETFEGVTVTYEDKINLTYVNVPLILKVKPTEGLAIEVGPQIGVLVSAKNKYEVSGGGESESGDDDIKDTTSGIDFGAGFGASYTLDNGLFFGARYNLGLSNVYDGEGADDYKIINNVIQASVGFFFN